MQGQHQQPLCVKAEHATNPDPHQTTTRRRGSAQERSRLKRVQTPEVGLRR
jgi:hypothetical protein